MDNDRIAGSIKQFVGAVRQTVGKALGDVARIYLGLPVPRVGERRQDGPPAAPPELSPMC